MSRLADLLATLTREAGWENSSGARAAALELAGLPGDEVFPALVAQLEKADRVDLSDDAGDIADELWRQRAAIEAGLIALGPRAATRIAPLLTSARCSPRDQVLARVGAQLGVVALFPVLEAWARDTTEESSSARLTALQALGQLGLADGARVIRESVAAGATLNAGWLKRTAATALGRLQDTAGLQVMMDDSDWFARLGVMEALPQLRDTREREALRARGRADVDERVRAEANR